jgi:ABC-type branched-subunit amino acid transport system ATPase component
MDRPVNTLLEVNELAVTYRGLRGLDGVSLRVPATGAVCLLGPNGAGKTTLLRAVSGLLGFHGGQVSSGTIRYNGEPVTRADPARLVRNGIVQVLEGRHVFASLTVEENLRSGAFARRARRRSNELFDQATALFPPLARRLRQHAGLLSGGEQQMLAIGRALMCDPKLLLLDEPSLGIAPLIVRSIGDALRQINEQGVGILLAEQSMTLAQSVTGHGYLIDSGTIKISGPTAELLADDEVRAAYLGVAHA